MENGLDDADRNWRRFVIFRVLFNSRFYYPVLAVLFLDLGLSGTQYTLLNFTWALAIVFSDLPAGVLADRIGRKPLIVTAAFLMVLEMTLLALAPRHGGFVGNVTIVSNEVKLNDLNPQKKILITLTRTNYWKAAQLASIRFGLSPTLSPRICLGRPQLLDAKA